MFAIVCEDVSRQLAPGTIIEGPGNIEQAKAKGCALLPYDHELPALANMGFVLTYFGNGWRFERNAGERGCPSILQVNNRCRFLYWAARLEPIPDKRMHGQLRLVHSSDNSRSLGHGMRQLQHVQQMPELDDRGGVTVFGKATYSAGMQGMLFTELYASGVFKVRWLALTQHIEDYRL